MMQRIYEKNQLLFAIMWIVIYVVGTSVADSVSSLLKAEKSITLAFHLMVSALLLFWLYKNRLFAKFGLCKVHDKSANFLYYIPLIFLSSCNLWFGFKMNMDLLSTVLFIGSMLCVGFLEELIFRGLLFKAMSKDSVRSAIIVSAATFGVGHIVNLFNGSNAEFIPTLCQVCYAMAFGFLFVIIFHRSGSLLPCIISHGAINSLSAFSNRPTSVWSDVTVSAVLTVVAFVYAIILIKTLPPNREN